MPHIVKEEPSLTSIDLFAGCGGLSLGLKKAGFNLMMANELSPMASESFAYNFFNENLKKLGCRLQAPQKTVWLSSNFQDLSSRLRENPFTYPELGKGYSDIVESNIDLNGKLVVSDIVQLNQLIQHNNFYNEAFNGGFYGKEVDLISGGPPCQSFSMAGLRKQNCDKNILPFEFCKFVASVRPKLVLLENVTGILRAFSQDGNKYYAWFEVAKAFALIGYMPICLHVNAKYAEVPQNRPRFILIGIRYDEYERLRPSLNDAEIELFAPSKLILDRVSKKQHIEVSEFACFDYHKTEHLELLRQTFLGELFSHREVSVADAIGDLLPKSGGTSKYVTSLNQRYDFLGRSSVLKNHEFRKNSDLVKKRFRLYQVLNEVNKSISSQVLKVLSGKENKIGLDAWDTLTQFSYYQGNGHSDKFENLELFLSYLRSLKTKKHSQRALVAEKPAPAALSIPDDVCHYDESQLRTLSVREMARIQSFPDSFCFRSKITTGGTMRHYEVPQYTQVGNAVPPNLGYKLGLSLKELLRKVSSS